MEAGTNATNKELRLIGQELSLCERYYQAYGYFFFCMNRTSYKSLSFPRITSMRASPTETYTLTEGSLYTYSSTADRINIGIRSSDSVHTQLRNLKCDAEL
ncbi:hypothetical protein [Sulfurimonas sp.]|uniref:hypothetical protein n=1 Tax=Sulfurimonas sp. TaxID=2022749 RepID=UPI0025E70D5C|nr:hypothetical protein [Sulfurimonas sp.]